MEVCETEPDDGMYNLRASAYGSASTPPFSCPAALITIVFYNKALYRARHASMMQLNSRYQLDENIRGSKYLIPVAVNNVLSKVVYVLLIFYSLYFTDIPLGYDRSHLSHVYELLFAYERIFFVLALTIRSQKFEYIVKRNKRVIVEIRDQANATSSYFTSLRMTWS
ncbi:hypothetical protein Y032_0007g3553 [Ancylostoma ceylanicum]|uniref:Uncharacterized protein n=1 Tax=Ancylostoma ceylanicum TaxID=53326 RepID=A0A016VQP0_9BILA|nr:hypothetical protein Y032_0007g3553 [Ancylostoma ceylanicum]